MTTISNSLVSIGCFLFVLLLIVTIVEDFKYRAVRWWVFPLLGLTSLTIEYNYFNLTDVFINSCFILIQFAMLSLYFSIKEKKFVIITHSYLGWGDVLLWLVLCLLFSRLNFILFFMGSMFLISLSVILWRLIKIKPGIMTIPLAGMQAITLLLAIIMIKLLDVCSFRNDSWIEKWLMA